MVRIEESIGNRNQWPEFAGRGTPLFDLDSIEEREMQERGLSEGPVDQKNQILYKDFIMWANPMQLAESGEWTIEVHIMRKNADAVKRFSSKNTFKTEREAVYHCEKYGKLIIDRKMAGCFIDNI